jgi:hypothetical protein
MLIFLLLIFMLMVIDIEQKKLVNYSAVLGWATLKYYVFASNYYTATRK